MLFAATRLRRDGEQVGSVRLFRVAETRGLLMLDQPSTDVIWSHLSADLRRFIRRRVSDDHIADDLLQDTFVRVHRNIDRVEAMDRLAAWVFQIARNVVRDHHRKPSGAVSIADSDQLEAAEDDEACRCNGFKWLGELVQALPDGYREAVQLAEIEGLSQQEVANRLCLTLSGAKSRIQRGRTMMKEALDRCCRFEFDRRGNLTDYEPHPDRNLCADCD